MRKSIAANHLAILPLAIHASGTKKRSKPQLLQGRGFHPQTGREHEYEKEIHVNVCLKYHNAKMFNSFHASEELIDDAENGGFRIMPTMEEGCLDYKKKENED